MANRRREPAPAPADELGQDDGSPQGHAMRCLHFQCEQLLTITPLTEAELVTVLEELEDWYSNAEVRLAEGAD